MLEIGRGGITSAMSMQQTEIKGVAKGREWVSTRLGTDSHRDLCSRRLVLLALVGERSGGRCIGC